MSFFLYLLPFAACTVTATLLLSDYLNSFGNDQFTTMDLPHAATTPAPKLKVLAKAAAR